MDDWQKRYKRAVLDFVGAPENVDLDTVEINVSWDRGYAYSSYSFADPEMCMDISWTEPENVPWPEDYPYKSGEFRATKGQRTSRDLTNEDVARLIRSFN